MKIKDLHGKVIADLPDGSVAVFETPTGNLHVCISHMGNKLLVAADDGQEIRTEPKEHTHVFVEAVITKGTPEEQNQLIGRYARHALPEEHYLKIQKTVDYSGKSLQDVDQLVGAETRKKKTAYEFNKMLRAARGYFAARERRESGEATYQRIKNRKEKKAR